MSFYNPRNHYWIVGGSSTQVYSSSRNSYVPIDDADYAAFIGIGNNATKILNEVELWGVLKTAAPDLFPDYLFNGTTFVPPTISTKSKPQLIAYAAQKRWEKEVGGITVTGQFIETDDRSKQMILGARTAADADAAFTAKWSNPDATVTTLTAAQIITISNAVLAHVNNCFTIYSTVLAGINGNSITTMAAIDTAFV